LFFKSAYVGAYYDIWRYPVIAAAALATLNSIENEGWMDEMKRKSTLFAKA
jgi:adenosylmethionine-8-amino-7-oxononanoate aminotransferase